MASTHSDPLPADFEQKLQSLRDDGRGLASLIRGIEKESLRVSPDGNLALTPHPPALGSPLTHPTITTDFSEAQLELITGIHPSPEACLAELEEIHQIVFAHLGDELLWPSSMPCLVGEDGDIPVGVYGSSNIGQAKTVYRRGLGVRYGRLMQTISGIHYNFSLPEEVWQALGITDQTEITAAYFDLIRNFRRWSWLLIYLFGASPSVCRSFTRNLQHNLEPFDEGTLHLPFATSLRMGPLGYQSSAQSSLHISYNSLDEYAASMVEALTTEYPLYAHAGVIKEGEYQQLNTNVLQIENEFYGTIRPKRSINPGERPVNALKARGVEYVEVRCIDLNPFESVGIDATQMRFIDTFLLLCLLKPSGPDSVAESGRLAANQLSVVERGRDPNLNLCNDQGENVRLTDWAKALLTDCQAIAAALDEANDTSAYSEAWQSQSDKVDDASLTPSAQVLATMREEHIPFFRFTMDRGRELKVRHESQPPSANLLQAHAREADNSLLRQQEAEASDQRPFAEFLEEYLQI